MPNGWNSLEVVKLVVAFMTPVLIFVLGFMVTRAARRFENERWINQKLIERRIELHKEMAPKLNDVLCFLLCIGHFREIDPPQAVARKRSLDRLFFTNEHLFSPSFRSYYDAFIDSAFDHWNAVGRDARIKASPARLRMERGDARWEADWDEFFVDGSADPRLQSERYSALMGQFSAELGVAGRPA